MSEPSIVWFRRDLRLHDNTALGKALARGLAILPVFILDERLLHNPRSGAPRLKFMLAALHSLNESLRAVGGRLLIQYGDPVRVLSQLVAMTQAQAVYFNADYTPFARQRDKQVEQALACEVHISHDMLLHPPNSILKADGTPYVVYTPFRKQWLGLPSLYQPHRSPEPADFYHNDALHYPPMPTLMDLGWADTIDIPPASEVAAQDRLNRFVADALARYAESRDALPHFPWDREQTQDKGTSGVSPYLRFGLISPRQVLHSVSQIDLDSPHGEARRGAQVWISELAWRDFYHHILFHFPQVKTRSFRSAYDNIQWRNAPQDLQRWQAGQTGYPVVDAAMRQLTATGWMHNRARMIVASFLTKDLLIDWREGERFFMNWLVDGDLAANNGGWQWSAGTGTDAQPYFRVFNPISQAQKFDPTGDYIQRWVPELHDVPLEYIHTPWHLSTPPHNYPPPIVDHAVARRRAVSVYKQASG
jgi:deoxyribodipyrimidine photo-lyase